MVGFRPAAISSDDLTDRVKANGRQWLAACRPRSWRQHHRSWRVVRGLVIDNSDLELLVLTDNHDAASLPPSSPSRLPLPSIAAWSGREGGGMASSRRRLSGDDVTLARPADLCGRSEGAPRPDATKSHRRIVRHRCLCGPVQPPPVVKSGPKAAAPSTPKCSPSFTRARLTRLFMVPTAHFAISAASS
jgi:hypothetical protein